MSLIKMLEHKEMKDLLKLLGKYDLEGCLELSQAEMDRAYRIYADERSASPEFYMDCLEKDEPDWSEYAEEGENFIENSKKIWAAEQELGRCIKTIENSKESICKTLQEHLTKRSTLEELFLDFSDESVRLIRKLVEEGENTQTGDVVMETDLKSSDSARVISLEDYYGICKFERTPAYKSNDGYEHLVAVSFDKEVLDALEGLDTLDNDTERKIRHVISDSNYVAIRYNDALPIETAYEFFKSYAEQTKECPVLSFEEFVDKSLECTKSGMHCICEYKSKKFLTEPGNLETIITDGEIIEVEVNKDDYPSFFEATIEQMEESHLKHYIPSSEEMKEYLDNGYWPSRECYNSLKDLITEIYLDEQSIENASGAMFGMFDEEEWGRRYYSMDDVENNVRELTGFITMSLMGNNDAEDILDYDDLKVVTWSLNDEVKQELKQIIIECSRNTNMPSLLGHTEKDLEK